VTVSRQTEGAAIAYGNSAAGKKMFAGISMVFSSSILTLTLACETPSSTPPSGASSSREEPSPATRIAARSFPSAFQSWNVAEYLNDGQSRVKIATTEDSITTMARHDLVWRGLDAWKLKAQGQYAGEAESFLPESVHAGLDLRGQLLAKNPNVILIAEIRYKNARGDFYPEDSPFWQRDGAGNRIPDSGSTVNPSTYFLLNFALPEFQDHVARQCKAAFNTGVVDGCFLDWWVPETASRIQLLTKVRAVAGDEALIIVNVNGTKPVKSANLINGIYMEGLSSSFFNSWKTAADNIVWASANLKAPRIIALEAWFDPQTPVESGRNDQQKMRRLTTLMLTHGDGYVLYGDPNSLPTPDHLHDWYPFWDKRLGTPVSAPHVQQADGSYQREFQSGLVTYNPTAQAVTVHTDELTRSMTTGSVSKVHTVKSLDGDLLMKQVQ